MAVGGSFTHGPCGRWWLLVVPPHVEGGVGPPRQPPPKLDRKVLAPLGRPSTPLDPHREASRVGQRAAFYHILEGGVPREPRKSDFTPAPVKARGRAVPFDPIFIRVGGASARRANSLIPYLAIFRYYSQRDSHGILGDVLPCAVGCILFRNNQNGGINELKNKGICKNGYHSQNTN